MNDFLLLGALLALFVGIGIFVFWLIRKTPPQMTEIFNKTIEVFSKTIEQFISLRDTLVSQMQGQTENFYKAIDKFNSVRDDLERAVPKKVLQSIQGSINPTKGKAGELIVYMKLFSAYSRIFAFGKPIDFMGVTDDSLDFIEVKTGHARLTDEEKKIRDLVLAKKINFITVHPELSIQTDHDIAIQDETQKQNEDSKQNEISKNESNGDKK